ncbi:MAG: hypothetical protein R2854_10220 [Caldilineaceae bacterium]
MLYTRGLLNTYVEALAMALFGASYAVGRRERRLWAGVRHYAIFRARAARVERTGRAPGCGGVDAAAGRPSSGDGRARFYSQLQFFTLLTAWAAFAAITTDPRDVKQTRSRLWAFAALFVLALFSQEETLLLYPSLLLAMLLWWGWRRLLRPDVLAVHGVLLAAMAARYAIELWGQPGYFETIQATRPYVGLVFDVAGAWRTYAPLFIARRGCRGRCWDSSASVRRWRHGPGSRAASARWPISTRPPLLCAPTGRRDPDHLPAGGHVVA